MTVAKKVVLVSRRGYDSSHDALLASLIDRRIELFCAVGKDCELWEEVMDELVVAPDGAGPVHDPSGALQIEVQRPRHPDQGRHLIAVQEPLHLAMRDHGDP